MNKSKWILSFQRLTDADYNDKEIFPLTYMEEVVVATISPTRRLSYCVLIEMIEKRVTSKFSYWVSFSINLFQDLTGNPSLI